MAILHSYPFCPQSRFARLVFAELGPRAGVVEEKPWIRRIPFLEINPAGQLPLFVDDNGLAVAGPPGAGGGPRRNARRGFEGPALSAVRPCRSGSRCAALLDWFLVKFHGEVSDYLATGKESTSGSCPSKWVAVRRTWARFTQPGPMCDTTSKYIGFLISKRNWLAGDQMTYADLAAAAICRWWIISATCHGTRTKQRNIGTPRSSPGRPFAALLADRVPGDGAGGPIRRPGLLASEG